jgi:hypothetical protein
MSTKTVATIVMTGLLAAPAQGITLGQVDDFASGQQGWAPAIASGWGDRCQY